LLQKKKSSNFSFRLVGFCSKPRVFVLLEFVWELNKNIPLRTNCSFFFGFFFFFSFPSQPSFPCSTASKMETLAPLTCAAATTAFVMYPVDVVRALKMASAGGKEAFSLTGFIKSHGVKGLASQGAMAEIVKSRYLNLLNLCLASLFFFFFFFLV
jgi:hypothetical protein